MGPKRVLSSREGSVLPRSAQGALEHALELERAVLPGRWLGLLQREAGAGPLQLERGDLVVEPRLVMGVAPAHGRGPHAGQPRSARVTAEPKSDAAVRMMRRSLLPSGLRNGEHTACHT